MYKRFLYLLFCTGALFSACSENEPAKEPTPDSSNDILSFRFKEVDSTRTPVTIVGDSIRISVPRTADLSALTPILKFNGASIEPLSGVTNDFSTIKTFKVTAEDQTQKTYYVKVQPRDAIFIGGLVQLLALDSWDGSLLWRGNLGENFAYSNPLLKGDTLYAGNISGYMYAFHVRTGQTIWRTFLSITGVESPATIQGNTLYVGHNDDYLAALDAVTGKIKWQFQTGANVSTKPLLFQNLVIFGSSDGYVYALDAAQGDLVWEHSTGGMIVSSSPVLSNGVIFIGSRSNQLIALDAATGEQKWAYITGVSMEHATPVVWSGTIYATGGYDVNAEKRIAGSLYALDEQTGAMKWHALDSLGFSGTPTIAEGLLFAPADDGNFYAVNTNTGAIAWSKSIYNNGAGAAIKNGIAYVSGGGSRNIYALDARTGNTLWTYPIPDDLWTSDPAIGRTTRP